MGELVLQLIKAAGLDFDDFPAAADVGDIFSHPLLVELGVRHQAVFELPVVGHLLQGAY